MRCEYHRILDSMIDEFRALCDDMQDSRYKIGGFYPH